jgi:DNA-binding response OmpR family regulator
MPTPRVLVLDDERLVRWSLSERLKADGMEPVQAASAAEALEIASKGIDAALLDYSLPDSDGISVLRKLRQFDPDVPVIMLTANTGLDDKIRLLRLGASDYMTKAFDPEELLVNAKDLVDLKMKNEAVA